MATKSALSEIQSIIDLLDTFQTETSKRNDGRAIVNPKASSCDIQSSSSPMAQSIATKVVTLECPDKDIFDSNFLDHLPDLGEQREYYGACLQVYAHSMSHGIRQFVLEFVVGYLNKSDEIFNKNGVETAFNDMFGNVREINVWGDIPQTDELFQAERDALDMIRYAFMYGVPICLWYYHYEPELPGQVYYDHSSMDDYTSFAGQFELEDEEFRLKYGKYLYFYTYSKRGRYTFEADFNVSFSMESFMESMR